MIDLHLHTTASDGRRTPAEVVRWSALARLTVMAVTDHDTTAAVEDVRTLAARAGIEAIAGIEITAIEDGRDVHMLGYFFDPSDGAFAAFLEEQRAARLRRTEAITTRLAELGMPVTQRSIFSMVRRRRGRSIGRPQIAEAMVKAGYVTDLREAFDRWLGEGCPAFVPREGPSPATVIEAVHAAGGLISLAHPGRTRIDRRIPALAEAGLDALEVYHPDHDRDDRARYRELAASLGLLVTGGSDFHGDTSHGLTPGSTTLPPDDWARLREASRRHA